MNTPKRQVTECLNCHMEIECTELELGPPQMPPKVAKPGERGRFWICDLCYEVGAHNFAAYPRQHSGDSVSLASLICAVGNVILRELASLRRAG